MHDETRKYQQQQAVSRNRVRMRASQIERNKEMKKKRNEKRSSKCN